MTRRPLGECMPLAERIRPSRYRVEDCGHTSPCWLWLGHKSKKGYGYFARGGRLGLERLQAHRVSYEVHVGPIPEGHDIHHDCEQPACINPEHLRALPHAEHTRLHFASRTHCIHGHEFTPENTYVRSDGTRACRACSRISSRAYVARKKAA